MSGDARRDRDNMIHLVQVQLMQCFGNVHNLME